MEYRLAKQLKDAGFQQAGKGHAACDSYDDDQNCRDDGHIAYLPTLSELIKACGDSFDYLRAPYGSPEDTDFDVFWSAFSRRNNLTTPLLIKVQGEGSTAEDAVAKLWLKLNSGGGGKTTHVI